MTLAAVLLVALFAGRWPRGRKVALAALSGPGAMVALTMPFGWVEGEGGLELLVGVGAIMLIAGVMIGWPIAFFATRRHERLTRFDPSTFE
jgi:hypothetical protein